MSCVSSISQGQAQEPSISFWTSLRNRLPLDHTIFAGISLATLISVAFMSRHVSFWYDELYTIGLASHNSLSGALAPGIAMKDPIPPLYTVFLWLWIRVLNPFRPFGEIWLILPSIIAISITIFMTGLIARRVIGSGPISWIACLLCALSANWVRTGAQVRYYGFLFMLSAVVLYLYVRLRMQNQVNNRWAFRITLGVAMAVTVMTGYSTLFWLTSLFLIDAFWIIRKKLALLELSSYAIGALICLPWGLLVSITMLSGNGRDFLSEAWPPAPTLVGAITTYSSMATTLPMTLLYLFSVVLIIVAMSTSKVNRNTAQARLNICFLLSPAIFILLILLYSIATASHGSLMVSRYFYQVWPMLCLTMAQAVAIVLRAWRPSKSTLRGLVISSLVIVCALLQTFSFLTDYSGHPHFQTSQPYSSVVTFLNQQPEIRSSTTIVYVPNAHMSVRGWEYFYVTAQGTKHGFQVTSAAPFDYQLVYVFYPTFDSWTPTQTFTAQYTLVNQDKDLHIAIYQRS